MSCVARGKNIFRLCPRHRNMISNDLTTYFHNFKQKTSLTVHVRALFSKNLIEFQWSQRRYEDVAKFTKTFSWGAIVVTALALGWQQSIGQRTFPNGKKIVIWILVIKQFLQTWLLMQSQMVIVLHGHESTDDVSPDGGVLHELNLFSYWLWTAIIGYPYFFLLSWCKLCGIIHYISTLAYISSFWAAPSISMHRPTSFRPAEVAAVEFRRGELSQTGDFTCIFSCRPATSKVKSLASRWGLQQK